MPLLRGRSAKFGVAVITGSMLNWQGWGWGRSASRSAKFGVAVFTGSMLDWQGGADLPLDLPI